MMWKYWAIAAVILCTLSMLPVGAQDDTPAATEAPTEEPCCGTEESTEEATEEAGATEEADATEEATEEADATEEAAEEAAGDADAGATEEPEPPATAADALAAADNLTIFTAAVDAAGLTDALANPDAQFTVFAPRDGAFGTLAREMGVSEDDLLADTALLSTLVPFHIAPAVYTGDALKEQSLADQAEADEANPQPESQIATLSGAPLLFRHDAGSDLMLFMGATAVLSEQNIEAGNGVVHVLDNVLMPPPNAAPVTVADGMVVEVTVTPPPPGYVAAAPPLVVQPTLTLNAGAGTLPDVMRRNNNLLRFLAVVDAAGQTDMLANPNARLTVFAPTNQAMNNLLSSAGLTEAELLRHELVGEIVRYHILPGEQIAVTLATVSGQPVPTLLPDNYVVPLFTTEGDLFVNQIVEVISVDVKATNGVIHIVDEVLLPQSVLEAFNMARG